MLPHFKRLERYNGIPSQLRGGLGEFSVSDLRNDHPYCRAWIDAAAQYGLPRNAEFNGDTTSGVGSYQLSIGSSWRMSSAVAFLHPARRRANLTVLTKAHATRITMQGSKATGVEYIVHGEVQTARAEREVIISAGALQSPQLLQLSGIGSAAHLRRLGINSVAAVP